MIVAFVVAVFVIALVAGFAKRGNTDGSPSIKIELGVTMIDFSPVRGDREWTLDLARTVPRSSTKYEIWLFPTHVLNQFPGNPRAWQQLMETLHDRRPVGINILLEPDAPRAALTLFESMGFGVNVVERFSQRSAA